MLNNQPAIRSLIPFALGILIGSWIPFSLVHIQWILLGLFVLLWIAISFSRFPRIQQISILLALFFLGASRFNLAQNTLPQSHLLRVAHPPQMAKLTGVLIRDPKEKKKTIELLLQAEILSKDSIDIPVSGKILISIPKQQMPKLTYGDRISVTGELHFPKDKRNPGEWDYKKWLSRQGIYLVLRCEDFDQVRVVSRGQGPWLFREVIYPLRRHALFWIDQTAWDQETRALLRALVLGEQALIPTEMREAFSKTGVVHLLSVSGSHVGFVYLMLVLGLGLFRFPLGLQNGLASIGLVLYALITEASPPVVRATVMALAVLWGKVLEKKIDGFNILGIAAFFQLLIWPSALFDIGFQLSFLSVFSIFYGFRQFKKWKTHSLFFQKMGKYPWLFSILSICWVSLVAQLGTLPLVAFYFNCLPIVSIPANLLAIPLSGVITSLAFISWIFSTVHPWIGSVYADLNQTLLRLFLWLIKTMASLPGSSAIVPSPSVIHIILWYSFFGLLFHWKEQRVRNILLFSLCMLLNISVWTSIWKNKAKNLKWVQFDVGQGDAAFLTFQGNTLLIDAGGKSESYDCGDAILVPYFHRFGVRKLDAIVLTHPHNDHMGGLWSVVRSMKVKKVILPCLEAPPPSFQALLDSLQWWHIPLHFVKHLDSLALSPHLKIYFFFFPMEKNLNESSIVTLVCYGEIRCLFMGDAEEETEMQLLRYKNFPKIAGIKIGHHGSCRSGSERFLQKLSPQYAVISVGERNRYGHPCPKLLERLKKAHAKVCRTDKSGAVILKTNGKEIKFVNWK